jgi:hypothetical protein
VRIFTNCTSYWSAATSYHMEQQRNERPLLLQHTLNFGTESVVARTMSTNP